MSYLALARKWRPKIFADVAGQDHIVRALVNALQTERVHHAYLFAGTRGIGKTTVARILAKALNCESGVRAEPCGECSACVSIDEGRFVDLIEVDAASRTKVEQTRELLENVQYTPTSGRYKVYLIDEVHMLSTSSFNALLKTLEEPPPHVKFLLATTDPQKLPVTVLSRCLQFNLKRLPSALIIDRMTQICAAEKIKFDSGALARIARAASGSMRDALSLLDQAVAFGDGKLQEAEVAEMLGGLDQRHLNEIIQCLAAADAVALMEQTKALQELVPDYESILDDLAMTLQQIAVVQIAGADSLDEDADHAVLGGFAEALSPDLVQLYYQIAVTGRRDLNLAPDPRVGFEMTLLRMLAFSPMEQTAAPVRSNAAGGASAPVVKPRAKKPEASAKKAASIPGDAGWIDIVAALELKGAARQLADNCAMVERSDTRISLNVSRSSEHLLTEQMQKRLAEAMQGKLGAGMQVQFSVVDDEIETVATREADKSAEQLAEARDSITNDPTVRNLMDTFGAEVEPESIQPVQGSQK